MENFYIILVVVLFALAISDSVAGVAYDAVNFLTSAVVSKAAHKCSIFSLSDRELDRDSTVFRVSGVTAVTGGLFLNCKRLKRSV
jgi:hypothetical protein